jgi:hypothetical protein
LRELLALDLDAMLGDASDAWLKIEHRGSYSYGCSMPPRIVLTGIWVGIVATPLRPMTGGCTKVPFSLERPSLWKDGHTLIPTICSRFTSPLSLLPLEAFGTYDTTSFFSPAGFPSFTNLYWPFEVGDAAEIVTARASWSLADTSNVFSAGGAILSTQSS